MSSWRTFPKGSWSSIGKVLSGFGHGEGSYDSAYAIDESTGAFLNGRTSAQIRLAGNQLINGAGLVCRANQLWSFASFYAVTDNEVPDMYSVRLAAFKDGRLDSLVGLKNPISIPDRHFHITLQFFSGEIIGEIATELETHTIKRCLPQPPFPGYCGAVRFYRSAVTVQNIITERITMKPILPESETEDKDHKFKFDVFLSHSNRDKELVLRLTTALREANIAYWIDHEQISFGDGIIAKIEEGLQKSRFVVACLSENLLNSGWCRAEYGPILYREFSGDTSRRVIPLSLDGSTSSSGIPLLLSDKMRVDFTDRASFSAFIKYLRESGSK